MAAFLLLIPCMGIYGQHSIKGTILESMSKQPLKEVLIQVKKAILEIKLEGYETQNIPIELSDTILDLGIILLFKEVEEIQDLSIIILTDDELNEDVSSADKYR